MSIQFSVYLIFAVIGLREIYLPW